MFLESNLHNSQQFFFHTKINFNSDNSYKYPWNKGEEDMNLKYREQKILGDKVYI